MTIPVRKACPADYPLIRTLLARAFRGDEADLWDHLVQHDPSLTPDGVRLALDPSGAPVACTVVLPRTMQGPRGPVSGAIITLVACHPDRQRQGYGGASVRDALAYMAQSGMVYGILYGHADYYPRFGYVPTLPEVRTFLPADKPAGTVELRQAVAADLPALCALFDRHLAGYPGAVARGPERWLWHLRKPATSAILVLADGPAYAVVTEEREQQMLYVHEAAADTPADARRLLAGMGREAQRRDLKEVRMATPPDHLVTRVAVLHEAEQHRRPAKHGMVAVTDWAPLLPPGYSIAAEGLEGGGRLVLAAPQARLVQLAFGYRTAADLLLAGEAQLVGGEQELAALQQAFPARFPKWSLDPFWL